MLRARRKPIPFSLRKEVYDAHSGRCAYCDTPTTLFKSREFGKISSAIDHIIPVKHGGSDARENLQLLCLYCNARKFDCLDYHGRMLEVRQ